MTHTGLLSSRATYLSLMMAGCTLWAMLALVGRERWGLRFRLNRLRNSTGRAKAFEATGLPALDSLVLNGSVVKWLEKYVQNTRLRLAKSGDKSTHPITYIGVKISLPLIAGVLLAILNSKLAPTGWWVYFLIIGLYAAPDVFLRAKTKHRQDLILRELPEFIDILAICADSGLNITECLRSAIPLTHGPLKDEMSSAAALISAGRSTIEALQTVLAVCDTPEMISFVSCITQSQDFGIPISRTLYDQSKVTRQILRQSLEAKMNTVPTKIALCIVAFLFPPIFVLLVLPSLLTFMGGGW